jgi:hypothetical protein
MLMARNCSFEICPAEEKLYGITRTLTSDRVSSGAVLRAASKSASISFCLSVFSIGFLSQSPYPRRARAPG